MTIELARSAHVDTFCRDNLPPQHTWPEFRFDLPELRYPERLNCAVELLDRTIDRYGPDRPCLLAPNAAAWSYDQVRRIVDQTAHVLTNDLGIAAGNRVLLRAPNNPWLVVCWLATLKAGAVVVTTMPLLRAGELSAIADIAQIDLALCDHRFLDALRNARLGDAAIVDDLELSRRTARAPDEFAPVDTAADDVAMLAFTSGTTGRPKATMHFHRDVLAIADTFSAHVIRPNQDDVFTGTPPLAFTFGLGSLAVFPLRAGASALLLEKATPAELADAITAYGATICSTAPTAYRAMLASGDAARLGTLRRAVSAGEHLPKATWQSFYDTTGVKIIDGIGSTEMLHVFVAAADDDIRPGSTGIAVPGYEAIVLDEGGREAAAGVAGRLAVKGPTGCRYLADPRQSAYVQNGWNLTGDTFIRDDNGYFYYQARNDDMIVSAGYNIAGPEVEEALITHPAVLECCVVGVPDDARGQLVKAFVVLGDGHAGSAELVAQLQDFTKQQIAPYKYPRAIEFVDTLPRTTTGKVQRYVLRQNARA